MSTMTPMMAQYMSIKEKYNDCILFYRLGDFYEMFFDDAKEASKILDITLTARNKKGKGVPIPMCGVPFHSSESYIAKLVKSGKKVAICEQVSPANQKGIVKREVVKIITPSTIFSSDLDDVNTSNFLVSISKENNFFKFCFCDLTTGSFEELSFDSISKTLNEFYKLSAKEVILSSECFNDFNAEILRTNPTCLVHNYPSTASENILNYLKETQKSDLPHIDVTTSKHNDFLELDYNTLKNLEVFSTYDGDKKASLFNTINYTRTSLGSRLLQKDLLHPIKDLSNLNSRLDEVSNLITNSTELTKVQSHLNNVYDLERIIAKLNLDTALPKDLLSLRVTLEQLPFIFDSLQSINSKLTNFKHFKEILILLSDAILDEPSATFSNGGYIRPSFDDQLSNLVEFKKNSKEILLKLQQTEIENSGINNLKVKYNKVFGYYFEVSKTQTSKVPEHFIRKQTLVNAERYITPELKDLEDKILSADSQISDLELQIFQTIRNEILKYTKDLQLLAKQLAEIDLLSAFAELAMKHNFCRPQFAEHDLQISEGRHPIVECIQTKPFIPNDTSFSSKNRFHLITGPNMGGKSTYLRQVALICYLAHIGSFVPAHDATIPNLDRIFTRIGASDSLSTGQSTFMVEMNETSEILKNASKNSLIILDELGRGTSTYDGLSIAWAVTKYIHDNISAYTLFATHYHELIQLIEELQYAKNFSVAVQEKSNEEITFLYKIIPAAINKSYGIHVAKLAGLPDNVIKIANQTLKQLEEDNHHLNEVHQLDIFSSNETKDDEILQQIKDFDLNNSTPMETAIFVAELKNKLK